MPHKVSESNPAWVEKVNQTWSLKIPKGKPILDLNEIVIGLSKAVKENDPYSKNRKILNKVNRLAQWQLNYYKSSRFGFVKEFFSSLHNLFTLGKFHSSAFLGKQMSQKMLDELKKENIQTEKRKRVKRDEKVLEKPETVNHPEPSQDDKIPEPEAENIKEVEMQEPESLASELENTNKMEEEPAQVELQEKINNLIGEPKILSIKEQAFEDLKGLWNENEKNYAELCDRFWKILFEHVEIVSWKKNNQGRFRYSIVLSQPISGKIEASVLPFPFKKWSVKLNQKIEFKIHETETEKGFEFNEEKDAGFEGPLNKKLRFFVFPKINDNNKPKVKLSLANAQVLNKLVETPFRTSEFFKYMSRIQWNIY